MYLSCRNASTDMQHDLPGSPHDLTWLTLSFFTDVELLQAMQREDGNIDRLILDILKLQELKVRLTLNPRQRFRPRLHLICLCYQRRQHTHISLHGACGFCVISASSHKTSRFVFRLVYCSLHFNSNHLSPSSPKF